MIANPPERLTEERHIRRYGFRNSTCRKYKSCMYIQELLLHLTDNKTKHYYSPL